MPDVDLESVVRALALAEIHADDCEEGIRKNYQKHTEMYVPPQECTCWVKAYHTP